MISSFGQPLDAEPVRGGHAAVELAGDGREHGTVAVDEVLHARALDLDHHRAPSCSLARWVWPIEAAASGSVSKLSNALSTGSSELPSSWVRIAPGARADVGLEVLELVGDRRRQQVGPGRGDLAELHEHPARVARARRSRRAKSGVSARPRTGNAD